MPEQVQRQKTKRKEEEVEEVVQVSKTDIDVDDILDEIDAVLEPNAQAFVDGFLQKGGQ